jgi:hypothetical protein
MVVQQITRILFLSPIPKLPRNLEHMENEWVAFNFVIAGRVSTVVNTYGIMALPIQLNR